jgi:hypothetical protein
MMHLDELVSAQPALVPHADRLRLAVAAYLARFKGTSRDHAGSDLRCYLAWCADRGLDPFLARRPHLELYIRWMQEVRRFRPSTVSRRFSVTAGFYRTCVFDGVLGRSPAEHVRRPAVPAESPALGFTHLQFEAHSTQPENLRQIHAGFPPAGRPMACLTSESDESCSRPQTKGAELQKTINPRQPTSMNSSIVSSMAEAVPYNAPRLRM